MRPHIPDERWQPLTLQQAVGLFDGAPFGWCIGGGYAVEQFLGRSIRSHGDVDVVVFRDEQLALQQWLADWRLYCADPPGTLREWLSGEYLPYGVHDIWGHQPGVEAWQVQIMLAEVDGEQWFSRRNPLIRGPRESMTAVYGGLSCIRIEVQLMFKAKGRRPRDEQDFQAALPLMDADAKTWLRDSLRRLHPEGHPWLDALQLQERTR